MSRIKIYDTEIKLDLMDVDVLDAYQQCMQDIEERASDKSSLKGETEAEKIKYLCCAVREAFEGLLGAETVKKIFAGKENNILAHMEVLKILVEEGQKVNQDLNNLVSPFMPKPNRAQRRSEGKKKKKKSKGKKK